MTEEEKAIKRLEEMTNNYKLNSEDLHYAIILYYLIINLQQENEKLNHYNLLYQKVKDRNDKAIEFIKSNLKYATNPDRVDEPYLDCYECRDLLEILKGNNE